MSVAALAVTIVFTAFPIAVDAVWPFSTTKAAQEDLPVLHDSALALLDPATNSDPNPSKGGYRLATAKGSALIAGASVGGSLPSAASVKAGSGSISLYQVREGDSLSEIADMFNVTINTILWANDIKDASTIQPGDTLLILPVSGVQHTVTSGQTLAGISKKYDADVSEVALFNGLDEDAALAVGDTIIIPGGDLAPKATAKTTTTKKTTTASKVLPALSGYFGNPLPGGRLTQGIHGYNGVDIGAPSGTPIYAAASGSITVAKDGGGYNGGYGNYLVISHDNGTQTLYAHLSSLAVSGGSVSKGDVIGYVGNTGRSTGYHLHFEVRGAKNPFAN